MGDYLPLRQAPLAKYSDYVKEALLRLDEQPDAIVIRGNSGSLIGGIVSLATGIPLVIVRKNGESYHGDRIEYGTWELKSFVIVDDLIASGATINAIFDSTGELSREKCIAIILYNQEIGHGDDYELSQKIDFPEDKMFCNR